MSVGKDNHLETVRSIQAELLQLLDGMDYCLDWKPDPSSWSAREVVYHLLDTPPTGIHSILQRILSNEINEFELWSDLTNMTPDRQAHDMEGVLEEISGLFRGVAEVLESAGELELTEKSAMVHQRTRGWDETRTMQGLLEGLFARHWREHMGQIRELRESLGM